MAAVSITDVLLHQYWSFDVDSYLHAVEDQYHPHPQCWQGFFWYRSSPSLAVATAVAAAAAAAAGGGDVGDGAVDDGAPHALNISVTGWEIRGCCTVRGLN